MKKTSATVVFFGSGPVAAKSLELLTTQFNIEAVVTKPKPKHHRQSLPVLDIATKLKLNIYTVENRAALSELIVKKPFKKTSVGVLIDFGIIIDRKVINYFERGIVNSHFSLLPQWRGADPISFAILSGQAYTGVSLMLLNEKMDEGPILAQSPLAIPPTYTNKELTNELIELSQAMLVEILPLYLDNKVSPIPQDLSMPVSYSRKLAKDDSKIDWHKTAFQLEREILAFNEWPKSHALIAGIDVIITKTHLEPNSDTQVKDPKPGQVLSDKQNSLAVVTGDGLLFIDELKPAGKKTMSINQFLQGYKNRLL